MTTKLNLTVNEITARKAKAYAARHKTSVSKLVDELLTRHISKKKRPAKSFVEKYAGTLKHHIADIEAEKDAYLKEKYGS